MFILINNIILTIVLIVNPPPFSYTNPVEPQIEVKRIEARREPTEAEKLACSCVKYVRSLQPELPYGDAKDLPTNGTPQEKGVAVFDTHISYIEELMGNVMKIRERYLHRISDTEFECITRVYWIGYGDEKLRGFWNP